jgi:hypothetical protein
LTGVKSEREIEAGWRIKPGRFSVGNFIGENPATPAEASFGKSRSPPRALLGGFPEENPRNSYKDFRRNL